MSDLVIHSLVTKSHDMEAIVKKYRIFIINIHIQEKKE